MIVVKWEKLNTKMAQKYNCIWLELTYLSQSLAVELIVTPIKKNASTIQYRIGFTHKVV